LVKIPYTTATNIFFSKIKELGNKTIGITGSKGKSTTTSLIYSILKEAGKNVTILGNIGNPMLEVLSRPINPDEIFVLELSSYQLDDIEYSPDIAVVTNLFPEHMDYHKGTKNYYDAKKNIIKFQNKNNVFVYNEKNKKLKNWLKDVKSKTIPFSNKNYLDGINLPLIGEHNKENTLAAVAVVKELGISDKIIKSAIEKFKPLPHRLEFVGEFKNIKFYDDAISTTPESTIMAIKALKNVDTIFLGGEDRGYNFLQLGKTIKKYKIKNIVLFPDSGKKIKIMGLNFLKTKNMEDAVKFAYKYTTPGKICLLSCASPSYSLWKNFEEKGDQFKKFIIQLK
ncbi:MAG: UDP-N-acetylmuramoyl-L-alanine--D-glutamate ligase, partial [Candidatus Staskawiczbacteria bacterium]|nr:UDP-N-acetylmuramoyl-L-alanine--D-glutamate ligase [Candidatus Staskawiczbacteria bacterium]